MPPASVLASSSVAALASARVLSSQPGTTGTREQTTPAVLWKPMSVRRNVSFLLAMPALAKTRGRSMQLLRHELDLLERQVGGWCPASRFGSISML